MVMYIKKKYNYIYIFFLGGGVKMGMLMALLLSKFISTIWVKSQHFFGAVVEFKHQASKHCEL